jgi:hypothetical protein
MIAIRKSVFRVTKAVHGFTQIIIKPENKIHSIYYIPYTYIQEYSTPRTLRIHDIIYVRVIRQNECIRPAGEAKCVCIRIYTKYNTWPFRRIFVHGYCYIVMCTTLTDAEGRECERSGGMNEETHLLERNVIGDERIGIKTAKG